MKYFNYSFKAADKNLTTNNYGKAIGDDNWGKGMLENIPEYIQHGMIRYILFGIIPGEFLRYVLEGDLFNALRYADGNNLTILHRYGNFLHNYAPSQCFGSKEAVALWKEREGTNGIALDSIEEQLDQKED